MYADYTDRYGHNHRLNRTSLAASSLICGALIASVALVAPKVMPPKPKPIEIHLIPIDQPPPPDPLPKPQPHPRTAQTLPAAPIPVVPLPQPSLPVTPTFDLPPLPPGPIGPVSEAGDGTGLAKPVPAPSPALIDAGIDPRYANDFQPPYPPSEERAGSTGVVTVRVLIGVDGRVKQLEPVRQTSDAFLAATRRQALSRWRFKPAMRGGIPVESWKTMTVRFVLND